MMHCPYMLSIVYDEYIHRHDEYRLPAGGQGEGEHCPYMKKFLRGTRCGQTRKPCAQTLTLNPNPNPNLTLTLTLTLPARLF
jgi:hypothetical protein